MIADKRAKTSRRYTMNEVVLLPVDAQDLVVAILQHHSTSKANALPVASALVAAEIDGQHGHGLAGSLLCRPICIVESEWQGRSCRDGAKSAAVRIDAANGFAYPAIDLAISELTNLAKESGIAAASIFRSHHFGQAGYHAERLAESGLVALVFGNSPKAIAPWGGNKAIFGTNPIAFSAPEPMPNLC